ncbi:hypothetical protein GQ55_2G218100 [Panicum hallii var. hallii]|uniref:Uncharacterized protein n=2 Tax=Panicum hallii TaxID=206008 RepID=A0A2T7ER51_9POAL|nr:hypothetical protein PAHAL_2G225600 [Panicum hallii]PUZ70308.1 hypothetical protein GQ55_2G218100 [Panicum hallii var. hallii]
MRQNMLTARRARENADTSAVYALASGAGAASRRAEASARRLACASTRTAVGSTRWWWRARSPWRSRAARTAATATPGCPSREASAFMTAVRRARLRRRRDRSRASSVDGRVLYGMAARRARL